MSHETIVYGYIDGRTWRGDEFRKYQSCNLEVLSRLPEKDGWLSRAMFSSPPLEAGKGTFWTQVIHFGGSFNYLDYEEIPVWVAEFENLLRQLYWFGATAHLLTERDRDYRFDWHIDETLLLHGAADELVPTSVWTRKDFHG